MEGKPTRLRRPAGVWTARAASVTVLAALLIATSATGVISARASGGATDGIADTAAPAKSNAFHARKSSKSGRINVRKAPRSNASPSLRETPSVQTADASAPTLASGGIARKPMSLSITAAEPGSIQSIGFPGRTDALAGCSRHPCYEPPNPGAAAGPNNVIHVVDRRLIVTSRRGALLETIALSDFFAALTADASGHYGETSPSALWDQRHGRWLVSQSSWDCRRGLIELAVSESSDPLGLWSVYGINFGRDMPSFLSMAASGDKIVFASDNVALSSTSSNCLSTTRRGASLTAVDWAELLSLPATLDNRFTTPVASEIAWRPAADAYAGTDVHLVGAKIVGTAWHLAWARVVGTIAGGTLDLSSTLDLTASASAPGFVRPPNPRVPGGELIYARDARPTGAVLSGDALWFVSSRACSLSGDTATRSCVRLAQIDVVATGGPRLAQDMTLGTAGYDTFGSGVGVARNGTVYLTYARSSPSVHIASYTTYRLAPDPPGTLHPAATLLPTLSAYNGERWGAALKFSPDPIDAAGVWQSSARPYGGGWGTWVSKLLGGRASVPSGTPTMNEGAVYGHSHTVTLTNTVPAASAATVIRLSNVPTTSNGILTRARTLPLTGLMSWSLADTAVGGSTAQGYRRVYAQFGDGRRWSPVVSDSLYVDLVRPTTTAPLPRFPQPGRIAPGNQIPVRLNWSARDSASGLSRSELQYTTDDVRWFGAAGNPAYTANGSRYRFRVRVVDRAGNWSNWAVGPIFWVNAYQETYTGQRYTGSWTRVASSGAYGGATRYSTVTRSSVTQTITGRAVGIVAPTGPTRGYARVYFDGVLVAVINLNSATENPRQFVYQRAWTTSGTHTIRMEVSGTAGHPRVDLDAILVLR